MPVTIHRPQRLFGVVFTLALSLTSSLIFGVGCGQHYSEKDADTALAERGLVPLQEQRNPHAGISSAEVGEGQVRIGELVAAVPDDWESQAPSGSMRIAQFAVHGPDGAAELAVFDGNWGSIDDNVDRWVGQFTQLDGRSTQELTQRWEMKSASGIQITMVDIPGTFGGGMGGGQAQANYRMLGAIVPGTGTFYYLKFIGPSDLIDAQREAFEALVQSLTSA